LVLGEISCLRKKEVFHCFFKLLRFQLEGGKDAEYTDENLNDPNALAFSESVGGGWTHYKPTSLF